MSGVRLHRLGLAATAFPLLALTVAAADPPRTSQATENKAPRATDRTKSRPREVAATRISGHLVSTADIKLRNSEKKHLLAKIETDSGRIRVADLGPSDRAAALTLGHGDSITVEGTPRPMGQTDVIFATFVRAGDETLKIDRSEDQSQADQSNTQENRETSRATVKGKVLRTKRVDWRNSNRREMVALVETDGGKKVLVDLGPTAGLRSDIKTGDEITANGQFASMGEFNVLFASDVTNGAREASPIDRNIPTARAITLAGTVEETKTAGLRGSDEKNLIVLLDTSGNRQAVVDLGNAEMARDFGIEAGKRIVVRGHRVLVNNRPILIATAIATGGKAYAISRPRAAMEPPR